MVIRWVDGRVWCVVVESEATFVDDFGGECERVPRAAARAFLNFDSNSITKPTLPSFSRIHASATRSNHRRTVFVVSITLMRNQRCSYNGFFPSSHS